MESRIFFVPGQGRKISSKSNKLMEYCRTCGTYILIRNLKRKKGQKVLRMTRRCRRSQNF